MYQLMYSTGLFRYNITFSVILKNLTAIDINIKCQLRYYQYCETVPYLGILLVTCYSILQSIDPHQIVNGPLVLLQIVLCQALIMKTGYFIVYQ